MTPDSPPLTSDASPKVALVAVELGRIQRGFERYFSDLFGVLRDEMDITLFKADGTINEREKIPTMLSTTTAVARAMPLGNLVGGEEHKEYKRDCIAFGLSLLPELMSNRYDVIHFIDPPLAVVFRHLQRVRRFRPRLLFTEGCNMPVEYFPQVAHIHHVGYAAMHDALAAGVPASFMTLVPCGVHANRFACEVSRESLRARHGISESTFVILVVSAIKRTHKRVDHIIEEVSRLEGDFLLWLDGNPEDADLAESARQRLGSKCRITHVASAEVAELHRMADVLVHASLSESFGLAIVEALCSGLIVLAHDAPHFSWLIQDDDCLLNMSAQGELAARLGELMVNNEELSHGAAARSASVRDRFDWRSVTPAYIEMYRKVASLNVS